MKNIKKNKRISSEVYLFVFLLIILVTLLIFAPGFYSINNVMSILNRLSYLLIASIGMNLIILTSNIDISAGPLISVICLLLAAIGKKGASFPILLFVAMITGMILSSINVLFITKLDLPATVATLATSQLFAGVLPLTVEGSIYDLPPSFTWLGFKAKVFGIIPLSVFIMIVIVAIAAVFINYSHFGKKIYAVGNNKQAARYAGINVNKIILLAYLIAGAMYGISATIIATASQRVTTTMGSGLEMVFIASVILGGTRISGGSGRIIGTVIGTIIMTLISPAINYLGFSSEWSDAIMGGIIIISVISSEWRVLKQAKVGTRVFNKKGEE